MIGSFARASLAAATLITLAAPAVAHSTLEVQQANLGASYKAVLRIPHGCGTEATHTVRVLIPEGFFGVKPMPKAGWTLDTVTGPYQNTYVNHGTEMSEGVTEIVWSEGNLPNEFYDEFVFRGTFADTLEEGPFYFPTIQECANGEEAWTDVSGSGDMPAPSLTLVAGGMDEHAHHGAMAAPAETSIGDLTISGAFTRATLPNAPVAGGFLTLTNTGAQDDTLIAVETPVAKEGQIHEMAMEGDVMKMRQLPDGLVLPAGETVVLEPGGYHLMFMGLTDPIAEGDAVPVTLTFEKAGTITLDLIAAGSAADAPAEDHSAHMGH
ncbi:copper chaperone PCu(A)C [uncultured Devosia sp.]|uniref:copper chaperone PCu(A)C n=1 Tax=uncultured Devosia sp. TaxID=211434 RepID=UPI002618F7C6|nr:copper chaperone PCu(A)C [uncultured Devosia sp.]